MGGNESGLPPDDDAAMRYAIRITFAVVHATLLSLVSLMVVFWFPALAHYLFDMHGCILMPLVSLGLAFGCSALTTYCTGEGLELRELLRMAVWPPIGVFVCSLLILPLQHMEAFTVGGRLHVLIATSICLNFIVAGLLQVYATRPPLVPVGASYSPPSSEE